MNRMYCTKNLKNLLFDIKLIAISTKKSPFPYSESRGNNGKMQMFEFFLSVGFNADFFFTTVHLWVYRAI